MRDLKFLNLGLYNKSLSTDGNDDNLLSDNEIETTAQTIKNDIAADIVSI